MYVQRSLHTFESYICVPPPTVDMYQTSSVFSLPSRLAQELPVHALEKVQAVADPAINVVIVAAFDHRFSQRHFSDHLMVD